MIKRILVSLFLLMPATFLAVDNIDWNQKLLDSAKSGNLVEVKNALKNGANIDYKNNIGCTALYYASAHGHENIIKLLLKNRANVESKNNIDYTALHIASYKGYEKAVKLLLESGANINAKNDKGWTALQEACFENNQNIAKLLRLFSRLKKIDFNSLWDITLKWGYDTMALSYYNDIEFEEIKFKNIMSEIDKINATKAALGFILNTDLLSKSPDKIKKLVKFYEKLNSLQFPDKFDKNLDNINKKFKNIISDKYNNIGNDIKVLGLKNYYKEVLTKVLTGYMLKEVHNLPSELVYKITQEF